MANAFDSYGNYDADLPLHLTKGPKLQYCTVRVKELREVRPKSDAHDCRRLSAPPR